MQLLLSVCVIPDSKKPVTVEDDADGGDNITRE